MTILHHKDIDPYLSKLRIEPEFECGNKTYKPTGNEWYRQVVTLEFPLGEMCKDFITTLALVGRREPKTLPIDGTERFNAQGLEGKCAIEVDLFGALMRMRDLLPPFRGRILIPKL